MDQIYPDDGLIWWLQQMVGQGLASGVEFDLFASNITPALTDTVSTYSGSIPSWAGYGGPIAVAGSAFTFVNVVAHLGSAQAPNVAFGNSSGSTQQAYGYIIRNPGGTKLLAAARFDSAPLSILNGAFQLVTPIVGDFSGLTS